MCINVVALEECMCFHQQPIQSDLELNVFVQNGLVDMHGKCLEWVIHNMRSQKIKTLKSQNLTLKIKPQNPNPKRQILKSQTT